MNGMRTRWLGRYEGEVARIFEEAADGLLPLPSRLADKGRRMLKRFRPLGASRDGEGGGTNYICFLLPLWLKEQTGCGDELCRSLAIGNLYAMLHFFLLDDVMDADASADPVETRQALALGQLLHDGFRRRYGRYFPPHSPLWDRYETYLADWAYAVTEEGRQAAEPADASSLARKSAPVKLCAAGMLLLSGGEKKLAQLEASLDLVLATLQLSDDWMDWRDDLAEGGEKRNAFLTLVRRTLEWPPGRALDERTVKRAVYRAGCLRRLAQISQENQAKLTNFGAVPGDLLAFHQDIVSGLEKEALEAEALTESLATEGGLSALLSNLANK
ncbi:hypothetical protein [Cohnella hongkongensis]|uniref:Polyprenyl synthetase n=1 Tax=Cohnella hongkongensis TaxID=178337 RepID=A0ABV9FBV5_9BACL